MWSCCTAGTAQTFDLHRQFCYLRQGSTSNIGTFIIKNIYTVIVGDLMNISMVFVDRMTDTYWNDIRPWLILGHMVGNVDIVEEKHRIQWKCI